MLKWPKGVEPEYEAIRDVSKFGRYELTEVDKAGKVTNSSVIQGWIVKPPPGAPRKSRWIIDLEYGGCFCHEQTEEEADIKDEDEDDEEQKPVPQFVPPGYKRKEVSLGFIEGFIPLSPETMAELKRAGAVEAGKVVYKHARPYYLTKRELMEIPPGKEVEVYVFDRNWGDTALEGNERGKKASFKKFFEGIRGTMSRNKAGDKLTMVWGGDKSPYTLDTEIMYAKDSWYPMTDGVLPAEDPQFLFKLLGKAVRWQDIDPETNVGYRGPIMLAKYANKMPKYVFKEW